MIERRSDWIFLILGLLIGSGWFVFNRGIDFGPYPVAADAVSYAQISQSFRSFSEAFLYAGDRTFGFPFVLYLVKRVSEVFAEVTPETLEALQTTTLLLFHFGASILFFHALREFSQSHGVRLHPIALTLLLVHPGLVSHTSVLLTDTFTADLVMIAMVLLLGARGASNRGITLRGAATGLVLGWAVATRPFFVVSFVSITALAMGLALLFRQAKVVFLFLSPMLIVAGFVLMPSVLNCKASFGKLCQQDPRFAGQAVATSLQLGLTSYRVYWSSLSRWESTIVFPEDWSMVENYKSSCEVGTITGPVPWLKCVSSKPLFFPVYLGKKLLGLFDQFFLQPYASDVTPSWVRRYSRAFNMISFVGFFCMLGILYVALKRKMIWEVLAVSLPLFTLVFQLPMHIEGRYSFSTVPIAVVAFTALFAVAHQRGKRVLAMYLLIAAALGGTFLVQTHLWDRDDIVLQRIEGWN